MQPQVIMIGDSITHFWAGLPNANHVNGPLSWQQAFGDKPVMNMGFGWDRTQNVLWRLRQGECDGLHPQSVVLAIGTNNLVATSHARSNTPEEIADGISAIYQELRKRLPDAHIVLMGIFPRGALTTSPLRAAIRQTNAILLERFTGKPEVTFLDIGSRFLMPDGSLPVGLMPDGTHPGEEGYRIWAEALTNRGTQLIH